MEVRVGMWTSLGEGHHFDDRPLSDTKFNNNNNNNPLASSLYFWPLFLAFLSLLNTSNFA
jgi:hypothetical protein